METNVRAIKKTFGLMLAQYKSLFLCSLNTLCPFLLGTAYPQFWLFRSYYNDIGH